MEQTGAGGYIGKLKRSSSAAAKTGSKTPPPIALAGSRVPGGRGYPGEAKADPDPNLYPPQPSRVRGRGRRYPGDAEATPDPNLYPP